MRKTRGFTLVELMISLAVFALLVTMAYQSVNLLLEADRRIAEPQAELRQLQRAMILIERDLHQLALLRSRNAGDYGLSQQRPQDNALVKPEDAYDGVLLEFTVGGNPDLAWQLRGEGLMRSTLQRVRYVFENGQLLRQTWSLVDRLEEAQPTSKILLTGLDGAPEFRFMLQRGGRFNASLPAQKDRIAAVELLFGHERFGSIRRIFVVYS